MKLDLRKLYAFKNLEIDTDLDLSKVDYSPIVKRLYKYNGNI